MKATFFRYVTKPWNLVELKSSVKEAFDKNALIRENLRMMEVLKNTNIILEDKVKKRTEELEKKNQELEKISNDKSKIIGIVAHDLRGSVGGILSLSQYIYSAVKEINIKESLGHAELNESLEFLELIIDSSKHLLELIDDILDVSAIETGKLVLNVENIHYIPFLNKVIAIDKELAKNKNITLLILMGIDDHVTIEIDTIKISQVINNFLQNAIKFSYPHGKIILKVEDDGDYITTKIIDEGKGILNLREIDYSRFSLRHPPHLLEEK
jgi:signal transduction histidine kinase